jgi:hypothetical protein
MRLRHATGVDYIDFQIDFLNVLCTCNENPMPSLQLFNLLMVCMDEIIPLIDVIFSRWSPIAVLQQFRIFLKTNLSETILLGYGVSTLICWCNTTSSRVEGIVCSREPMT